MVYSWVHYKPEQYLDYVYELPVQVLGWLLELQSIAIIILFGLWNMWKINRAGGSIAFFRVGPMLTPKTNWAPRSDKGI